MNQPGCRDLRPGFLSQQHFQHPCFLGVFVCLQHTPQRMALRNGHAGVHFAGSNKRSAGANGPPREPTMVISSTTNGDQLPQPTRAHQQDALVGLICTCSWISNADANGSVKTAASSDTGSGTIRKFASGRDVYSAGTPSRFTIQSRARFSQ